MLVFFVRKLVDVIAAAWSLALLVAMSSLVLFVTPFWLLEVLLSRRVSIKVAAIAKCEGYLDWLFSRSSSISGGTNLQGLRLWGVEFVYH